ncbi:MAG: ATP-binding protein [Paludibacteraceae bacterium]|nr:ATP-binding protein [Paludibacteraceae bacterium]
MKYPIGIQNFESLIKDGFFYVDKTALVHRLVTSGRYYFLSRPRRFGKSLLLSTFRAYFEGKKELFEGLALSGLETEWKRYPILHLDLNIGKYNTTESLNAELNRHLELWEKEYGDQYRDRSVAERFWHVIRQAYEKTGERVVILVDEYDKPLLQTIGNPDLQSEFRSTLKAFYGNLKSCDEFIRFAFLTGVTKFGKVSVFSDLNHLTDISLLPQFVDVCGISEKELRRDFDSEVEEVAKTNDLTKEACYARLKRDFDGYHFYPNTEGIYNPFSLLNTLAFRVFKDYWFETGTPTFLVHQLQKTNYSLEEMTREELTADTLNCIDVMDENPLPLLFQSGYLTIKDYDEEFGTYTLGFPNREVEEGFTKFLYPFYTPKSSNKSSFSIAQFVKNVRSGDAEGFMKRLSALFADGDYQIVGKQEIYFQNTLFVFFKLLGFYVEVERHTSDGRMDVVMQTKDYVYIIELKVDQTAEVALRQIEEKGYAEAFSQDPRKLYKIGINFNSGRRLIDDWVVE